MYTQQDKGDALIQHLKEGWAFMIKMKLYCIIQQDKGDAFPSTPEARRQLIGDPASRVALLPFSSGTTGLPKSVQLSHFNLVANSLQITTHEGLFGPTNDGSRDRALGEFLADS